ncbi:MAG TPA: hypothetical protein VIQ74_05075 [Gemmatimonadaceae bacterium]|jgi:hypothetical protein
MRRQRLLTRSNTKSRPILGEDSRIPGQHDIRMQHNARILPDRLHALPM